MGLEVDLVTSDRTIYTAVNGSMQVRRCVLTSAMRRRWNVAVSAMLAAGLERFGVLQRRPGRDSSADNRLLGQLAARALRSGHSRLPLVFHGRGIRAHSHVRNDSHVCTVLRFVALASLLTVSAEASSAGIEGELNLYPRGCQSTDSGTCKLGSELTYTSSRNGLVWQTDTWSSDEAQSGTTDGASIPEWARPIVGQPYDVSYLKAAIIHDHYCYKENHVRTWRDTHRMFYDAMRDSGVEVVKAKVMYFAVYFAGPKWLKLVEGEHCGRNCIKNITGLPHVLSSGVLFSHSSLNRPEHRDEILKLHDEFNSGRDYSIDQLETRAQSLAPDQFFFMHDHEYRPTSQDDKNLVPRH